LNKDWVKNEFYDLYKDRRILHDKNIYYDYDFDVYKEMHEHRQKRNSLKTTSAQKTEPDTQMNTRNEVEADIEVSAILAERINSFA
jgi:hypothetical protein